MPMMTEQLSPTLTEELLELRLLALRAISKGDLDRAKGHRTQLFALACGTDRVRDPEAIASLRSVDRFLIPALQASTEVKSARWRRALRRLASLV